MAISYDIVGCDFQLNLVNKFIENNKIPSSIILSGMKGIGKRKFANYFSKFILTSGKMTKDDIAKIEANTHPDLKIIENDDNKKSEIIKLEKAKEIASFLKMTSGYSGYKIVIIDAIDDMNINAENSILKILEEPPANSLLILINHNKQSLLPTINSRCVKINFAPMKDEQVIGIANKVNPQVIPKYENSELNLLLLLAGGSVGNFLDLCNKDALTIYGKIVSLLSNHPNIDDSGVLDFVSFVIEKEEFEITGLILSNILLVLSKYKIGIIPNIIPYQEKLAYISTYFNQNQFDILYQTANELYYNTKLLHLDKKQTILSLFYLIKNQSSN